ncbi:uncharacterized protein LOC114756712 [Neltuma alba]|uniref:uncharacterized protein LOC114756712 n=1 Tax=Neltuma alba TaxID=207710 RepID=UPI0010A2D392|nr:uncharacterized protein LOC114756712 [Prosopis alba]
MDRSWMSALRTSKEYEDGVEEFIEFTKKNAYDKSGKWIWHSERGTVPLVDEEEVVGGFNDRMHDMIHDVGLGFSTQSHINDSLQSDAEIALYPGCSTYTRLTAVLKLFNLKATNGWTDKSFTELLQLLGDMLLADNVLPNSVYEAKKILSQMGMGYEKIHVCPNDYILYKEEYADLNKCPKCRSSRYKVKKHKDSSDDGDANETTKGQPLKVLWYLPIIPRFKGLFANATEAKKMTWHVDEKISDGKYLRHPADSLQWKKIDEMYPEFGSEPRNLRLGLCTDGINPYNTHYHQLKHGRKTVYLGHRRFLDRFHPYRRLKKVFNGTPEHGLAPKPLTGEEVYRKVERIDVVFGKTKDGINVRLDLAEMGIRERLHPQLREGGKRVYLELAAHTFSKAEKTSLCRCLHNVKVPQSYSSNMKKLVLMDDLNKVIDTEKLDELEKEGYVILCQLEMYFPPAFFDIMVHLIVHLVREVRLCGPVYLIWMYPFERFMKVLKGYSKNPYRREASIVERYVAEEAIDFCKGYLSGVEAQA